MNGLLKHEPFDQARTVAQARTVCSSVNRSIKREPLLKQDR
jgi:hypothetical protein